MRLAVRALAASAALVVALAAGTASAQRRPADAAPAPTAPAAPTSSPAPVAPDPSVTTASYGDWTLRCEAPKAGTTQRLCEATQTVQVRGEAAPIAQIAFGHAARTEPVKLVAVLPVNATFTSPVTIAVGDKDPQPVQLAWHRCLPVGCFAEATSTADAVRHWRGETGQGRLTFKDGIGRDVVVPVSFRGLAQALDALSKQ